jgi:PIN domain nuclease of toxin-antitoxin system
MQIKLQLGKLSLQLPLAEMVDSQQRVNRLTLLPIQVEHVLALEALPPHHKDPFDRLLLAQAKIEGAVLLTSDAIFERYGIPLAT